MADPVSGVVIAGLALSAAGTAYSVHTARQTAATESDIADQNQQIAKYAAADAIARGQLEEEQSRIRTRMLIGRARNTIGASGIELGTGTALSLVEDTAELGELEALTIRASAAREAWGYRHQAADFAHRSRLYRMSGRSRSISTGIAGSTQILDLYAQNAQAEN